MRFVALYFMCILCTFGVAYANSGYTPMNPPVAKMSPVEAKRFFAYRSDDIVIGDPKTAKITVVGYTAYSCPHCNHFMGDILPKLKKEYFENPAKNIIYVYRTLPMSLADVKAEQLSLCKKMSNKERIKFKEMLYSTSSNWVYNAQFEKKLTEIARLFGFKDSEIFPCLGSKPLEDKILHERMELLSKAGVKGVPMIVVNGNVVEGYGYKQISEMIEQEIKLVK